MNMIIQTAPKVQILLSTYNGEKYLKEQLDSILRQDYPSERLHLLIRDDGSTDSTAEIIEGYVAQHPLNITLIKGQNIGYIKSFAELLKTADADYDFWGFADQDDVWFPQKIKWAVEKLTAHPVKTPLLYASFAFKTDSSLHPLKESSMFDTSHFERTFKNALVECPTQGCTIVINQDMKEILLKDIDCYNIGHDYWCGLVAYALGEVIYDPRATLYYRRHLSSTTKNDAGLKNWLYRASLFKKYYASRTRLRQTQELLCAYKDMLSIEKKKLAEKFIDRSLANRICSFFQPPFQRKAPLDQLIFRFLFLLNKL